MAVEQREGGAGRDGGVKRRLGKQELGSHPYQVTGHGSSDDGIWSIDEGTTDKEEYWSGERGGDRWKTEGREKVNVI